MTTEEQIIAVAGTNRKLPKFRKMPLENRFWGKVNVPNNPEACWEWTAALSNKGYGLFYDPVFSTNLASRIAWMLTNGPIPDGFNACHRCDNPKCVNPRHIFLGTQKDNMSDASTKGRMRGCPKLGKTQVFQIIALLRAGRLTMPQIAARYSVSPETISGIKHKRTWLRIPR